jgi:hypothetical protein
MYAPPWAREDARSAGDAGMEAVEKALNASAEFRRTLPPAASLEDGKRWRDKPFAGDIAVKHMRERRSLDPVALPALPDEGRRVPVGALARVTGAIGLAALAAFVVVGAMPRPLQASRQDNVEARPIWSRLFAPPAQEPPTIKADALVPQPVVTERIAVPAEPAALAERFAAVPVKAETEPAATPRAIQEPPAPAPTPPPSLRPLDGDELAFLLKRGEELIGQGDIAAARLMLTRAAEAGEARAALTLGATYDADMLRKLGVIGVAGDAAKARAWYEKAAQYGSGEATRRLEQFAQSVR